MAIALPKSMTTGSAGPFETISTKIGALTNNTTNNDAKKKLTRNLIGSPFRIFADLAMF